MKYSDIDLNAGFTKNMRDTPWTKLFPHWWTEDALTRAIGDEVERVKAQIIFALLNMGIKPPVMIWQRSLNHKEYKEHYNITNLPQAIEIDAPKYKTWGIIKITNNDDNDIHDLNIMFDGINGITIVDTIGPNDIVTLDLESQNFSLNNQDIEISKHGEGIPYFITSKYSNENIEDMPLSNEILRITFNADESNVDLDIDITLNNAVFINEQNIEVTSIELLPIDKIDLYVKYDFPFNNEKSGWKIAYTKEYQTETNVIYDMITTHFDTKEFYVEVFFRELEYPYKIGFPCYKDADEDSIYHVNNRLDTWGNILGLPRREYKTEINEMDYPFTFPIYYPFNIEQDFWYYSRLINEYCWNDEAINEIDLLDTEGHRVMRLHSINPFVEDFAIHAKTIQPTERENINYNFYVPYSATQVNQDVTIESDNNSNSKFIDVHPHRVSNNYQVAFTNIENLLDYNDNYSMVTLYNKVSQYITYNLYKSKELDLFFNLSNLPEHINIEGIEFTIDAESTDNSLDKYNDIRTRVELRSFGETVFAKAISESGQYELERKDITYGGKNILFDFDEKIINKKIGDKHVSQKFIIKPFSGTLKEYVEIPFIFFENDEEIDELKNVSIIYDDNQSVSAEYITEERSYPDGQETITEEVKLLRAYIPENITGKTITIQSLKSQSHYPFTVTFDIRKDYEANTDNHKPTSLIEGPIINDEIQTHITTDNWNTGDLRDILQKSGLHFIYTLQNDNETLTPTIIIHNITLKVFYSPKKTQFDLQTYVDYNTTDDTHIGQLVIDIKNTGTIPFVSTIDIFNEQNISLSTNSINVDLNPQDYIQHKVKIQQQPPLVNGVYDIVTMCENVKRQNTITIDTGGLIQTTTKVKSVFTQYQDETIFEAFVNSTDRIPINEGTIDFYINKMFIGTGTVVNGQATLTKALNELGIQTGFYNLEARYIGSDKYAPSRNSSVILISKHSVDIEITSDKHGNLNTPYTCEAVVKINDEPVTEGDVTFYLDDKELGRPNLDANGIASLTYIFDEEKPCSYELKAVYNGTVMYGHAEAVKNIILSGGATETIVYNVIGAPTEKITLSAKVIQKICAQAQYNSVSIGSVLLQIVDNEEILYSANIIVNEEGRVSTSWTVPNDIVIKDYQIICQYNDNTNVFASSEAIGTLSIQRKNVQLKHQSLFYGSRYEPLGFYIQICDENNEAVKEGQISVNIPSLNITATANVDSDSSAKIVHNAIDFTYHEWNELEHLHFKRGEGNVFYYDGIREVEVPENLYRIYDNDYRDLQYVDFRIENGDLYYKRESQSDEQVYIGDDGCLYARTNIDDINMDLKQYAVGTHDVIINYIPSPKYNATNSNSRIKITTPQVDEDLHSYQLQYNSKDLITCFVTQYDWTQNKNEPIHEEGIVYFYIDNTYLDKTRVQNGRAIVSPEALSSISANKHLLTAEYIPDNKQTHTYTYTTLMLEQIPSTINYQANHIFKGQDTHFTFHITLPPEYQATEEYNIYGNVDILLNDEKINDYYLFGNEDGTFETTIKIPDDIDEKKYELSILYEGTKFVRASSLIIPLNHTLLPVNIESLSIQVAPNEMCDINIPVIASDNNDITEGYITLYDDNNVIAQANVIHNNAKISFNIGNKDVGNYTYIIKYEDGINYKNGENNALLHVNVINALNKVYLSTLGSDINQGTQASPLKTLEAALRCVSDNGEIYILNEVYITQPINIDKNIYINGDNESSIVKDLSDLFQNNIENNLHIHNYQNISDKLTEIKDLTINNLNTNEFSIINKELYFLKDNNLIPIYLYDNGKFYSETALSINDINDIYTITSNKHLKINNITFKSNDNDIINDFTLINNGTLEIYHSIIQPNIAIYNYNDITMNRNLIYGEIHENKKYNLDNNWWGQNIVSHDTNNNIILSIKANIEPPVLGEDFHVIVEMIGENGRYYDIPQLSTCLSADTGYFQTSSGTFSNQVFNTLYVDAVEEGKIYATTDNETVEMTVYNYDRKTEIILDEAMEIPIGYQIPIKARVQSCADVFYQFDSSNNIINQTNNIDNGKVIFYIDDIQVGKAYVTNGLAEVSIFFSTNSYQVNRTYKLSAKYIADEYYFDSFNEKNISLISENGICFISPDGDNDNDGTFLKPLQTITAGILSNKSTIYLKDGHYPDTNIIINHSVNIKKYNNYAIFSNNTGDNVSIFNIIENDNIYVTLDGLDFKHNACNTIINNMNHLTINECIFYDNQTSNVLIDNIYSKSLKIYRSAIVNNDKIVHNINRINTLQYCWFGTNTPNENNIIPQYTINDYIVMDVFTSKDIIYIGTIARITARLKHYQHNDDIYILEDELPLRIAIFESDSGLLTPLKDYTYNNQATSVFNSNEISNSDRIYLSLPDNTNYLNQDLILQCNVTNTIGYDVSEGNVTFVINDGKRTHTYNTPVTDGIAKIQQSLKLKIGTYPLQCYYQYDNMRYSTSGYFNVQTPNIIINNCQLHNITLESMQIYAENIRDSLNKKIYNQDVQIFIDNENVYNNQGQNLFSIENGILSTIINYNIIDSGKHTLKISTENFTSKYELLNYTIDFTVDKYPTHIVFPYDKIQKDYEFDLAFKVLDINNNSVLNGYVDIYHNNVLIVDKYYITNGTCVIPDFKITTDGQHSFYINYHGNSHYYDSSYINNNINVGLYDVIIDSEELQNQLIIDSRANLDLKFQIKDVQNDIVNIGYVNIYIDGVKINDNEIYIQDEYVNTSLRLPPNTAVGRHDCTIEYIDNSDVYRDTVFNTYMYITQVPINIIVDNITTVSSTTIDVPYDIQSPYGSVTTGILTAYVNDTQIGMTSVANTNSKSITLYIPKLRISNENSITFKYTDAMGNYQETTENKILNIISKPIDITTSHNWYYPNKEFNFHVTLKDSDDEYVDSGEVSIYIDSVKETDNKTVVYGECDFILNFTQVKEYDLTVVYTDDKYYKSTTYEQKFKISALPISNISFENELTSVANTDYNNTIIFETFENHDVYDGIVDLYLNNDKKGTCYINNINKEFTIDIGDLDAGTYDFTIKYHDSELFDDYKDTFDFTITERTLNMNINGGNTIVTQLQENITLPTYLDTSVKGIIKYYIGVNEESMKFIGVTDINGTNTTYNYTLPKVLDEKPDNQRYYLIKAVFENNGKYQEAIAYCNLDIVLTTPSLNMEPITAYYHGNVNIEITNDIHNNALLEFYLNDEYIGAEVSNNGKCTFNYTLPTEYLAGEYDLMVKYNKTSIMNEQIAHATLTIVPSPVSIQSNGIEEYINHNICINAIGVDSEDRVVSEGTMSFSINDVDIQYNETTHFNINEQVIYKLPINIVEDTRIKVTYHTSNNKKYQNTISYIPLSILKHNIIINTARIDKHARGDIINIDVELFSNTIDNINVPISAQISSTNYTMPIINANYNNEILTLTTTLDINLDDEEFYDLKITSQTTDVFKQAEEHFKIPIYNKSTIYIDTTSNNNIENGSNDYPVHTLQKAINLISNNGNIIILSSTIPNEDINVYKDINIQNETTVTCHATFNINKKLSLSNFLFASYNECIFNNNGNLIIKDSMFENNEDQCIINNNILDIDNTEFLNNTSEKDGTCISIEKNNQHTTITNCSFTGNSAYAKGSCINSNKGNDIYIQGNYFGENNSVNGDGTYISTYGNMHIIENIFYPCDESAIYILDGDIQIELNIFHGDIDTVINNVNGMVTANMNYWGTNNNIDNKYIGDIDIDTWLLANYELESDSLENSNYIIGYINQYVNINQTEKYEFKFNDYIHQNVNVILYHNNTSIGSKYLGEKINFDNNTNLIINIFGNNLEVE